VRIGDIDDVTQVGNLNHSRRGARRHSKEHERNDKKRQSYDFR
jgi:hypothetical protein